MRMAESEPFGIGIAPFLFCIVTKGIATRFYMCGRGDMFVPRQHRGAAYEVL